MKLSRIIQLTLVACSLLVFVSFVFFGERGVKSYYKLKSDVKYEQKKVKALGLEVANLKKQIDEIKDDEFYKEKFAREDLLLGDKEELIYVLK
jgi:cell division protein FtsB